MPSLAVPPPALAFAGVGLAGVALGWWLIRESGARLAMARRFAASKACRVRDVLALTETPRSPLRIWGRVRCADPILTASGERLVAVHRTVAADVPGIGWRTIERVRESRRFQLWDHAGELMVDLTESAEPLVVIPGVWRGNPEELPDEYRPAIARLEHRHGRRVSSVRSETRTLSVVDHLLVVARPQVVAGAVTLRPPTGGYIVSSVDLDAAMRLLIGRHPRRLALGIAAMAAGGAMLGAGALTAIFSR